MKQHHVFFFYTLFASCLLTACIKGPSEAPTPEAADLDGTLTVPDGFDFRTSYAQEIEIVAQDEQGSPMNRIQFFLYTAPPEVGGQLIARGLTNEQGIYQVALDVSTKQQALYAYTPYLDLARAQRLELSGEGAPINHLWGTGEVPPDGAVYKTAIDTTFGCNPTFYQVIGNELKVLDVVSGTYMTLGAASSNYNGIGYNDEDGMIYGFKKISNSEIRLWRLGINGQETDLGVIGLPSSSYTGGNYKGDFDLNGDLYNLYTSGGNIILGKLDIDSLPLTAQEFTLTNVNGATGSVHDIAYNEEFQKFYSVGQNGHLLVIDHQALTIEDIGNFSGTIGSGPFGAVWCISSGEVFASQNNTGNVYRFDLDANGLPTAVTLQLVGESTSNNDGSGCVLAESPFNDTDQDGIPNGNDDYPDDSTVSTATYTPTQLGYGTYAFEDFWPKRGDYDFNDLVMSYNYEMAQNTNNEIVWMNLNFKLRALGAGFKTGFGISFDDLLPSQIASVSGLQTSTVSVASNGCENGQSSAVVVILDNAHEVFGVPVGYFVNTDQNNSTIKAPITFTVRVTFTTPISSIGTINPFIFSRGDRGYEIHLMNNPPTDLVDATLFGTEDDQTSGANYYVDGQGFPWGLQFLTEFDYPLEKITVRESHPKFSDWVRSSGSNHTNWYERAEAQASKIFGD